jgi:hypothetical protein
MKFHKFDVTSFEKKIGIQAEAVAAASVPIICFNVFLKCA